VDAGEQRRQLVFLRLASMDLGGLR